MLPIKLTYFTQSQYTDTRPASPIADPKTPGASQGNLRSTNFEVTGMTRPGKQSSVKVGMEPTLEAVTLPLGQQGCQVRQSPDTGGGEHKV